MLDRRTFLVAAGRAAAAAAAGFGLAPRRATGRSLRSLERIGLQLYTVRGRWSSDLEGTLQRAGGDGLRRGRVRGILRPPRRRSAPRSWGGGAGRPAAHVGFDTLGDPWRATLEAARDVGHRWVVVPWIPEPARTDTDGYRRVARALQPGRRGGAREVGLSFAYHNHDFEFEHPGGELPFDVLLEETDPAAGGLRAGRLLGRPRAEPIPVECFARFSGRFPLAHLKDMDADGAAWWTWAKGHRLPERPAGAADLAGLCGTPSWSTTSRPTRSPPPAPAYEHLRRPGPPEAPPRTLSSPPVDLT
jgi:hypothetical protein